MMIVRVLCVLELAPALLSTPAKRSQSPPPELETTFSVDTLSYTQVSFRWLSVVTILGEPNTLTTSALSLIHI